MRWCGVILLACLPLLAQSAEEPPVYAPQVESAPRVDGRIDEEVWSAAPASVLNRPEQVHPKYRENWNGPDDLSGRLQVLRTSRDLFLAIEITDDVRMHESGAAWWVGDSIEIFFDLDLTDSEPGDRYSNDDLQLFILPFHEGQRWGVVARGPDRHYPDGGLRDIEVAHTEHEAGYRVEVRIPLATLDPLRPDAEGRIGFDLALNDVDEPGATATGSYMTLSGRFDLFANPGRFTRLLLGPIQPEASSEDSQAESLDWASPLAALAALALLVVLTQRLARMIARRPRAGTTRFTLALVAGAALIALLPSLVGRLDSWLVRGRWRPALDRLQGIAQSYLDLEDGSPRERGRRLLHLLDDGELSTEPSYSYRCLPLTERARGGPTSAVAASPFRYAIPISPGEERVFPLQDLPAPSRIRIDFSFPAPGERELGNQPAAEVRVDLEGGARIQGTVARDGTAPLMVDASEATGKPMRRLRVRNLLPYRALSLNACFGEQEDGSWRPLPLAMATDGGIPFDVGFDAPATHFAAVPKAEEVTIPVEPGQVADRLWIALSSEGAYPNSPYGVQVLTLSAEYADGEPPSELRLVNGTDLIDNLLDYPTGASQRERIALFWETGLRLPRYYTLHVLDLDPGRTLRALKFRDHGVLASARVAAATLGRRIVEAPPAVSGLLMRGNLISIGEAENAPWRSIGLTLRSPNANVQSRGPAEGVRVDLPLNFGSTGSGTLEAWLPRSGWANWVLEWRRIAFIVAALLLTCAAVVAGEALLQRARRLRVKMLIALGAATVMPLLFLAFTLSSTLHRQAEKELEEATRSDLRSVEKQIESGMGRARGLAAAARDTIEVAAPQSTSARAHLISRTRAEMSTRGAFLRVPDQEEPRPSPLGNAAFVDSLSRSGLYYSPWDGLLAVGVSRAGARYRYLVGLPAQTLIGAPPSPEVSVAIYSPDGELQASTGSIPARAVSIPERSSMDAASGPHYVARIPDSNTPVAAAHTLLQDGDRTVAVLAVYRSRLPTEQTQASIVNSLLLASAVAFLLVVLAGVILVDRVTQRLQRVTSAAQALAHGDLEIRVPVESADEVGGLAASFNVMADALDQRIGQLTDLHRGVQELTAVLEREEVARVAAGLLARASGAKHVVVTALERATDRLELLHEYGTGAPLGMHLPDQGPARSAVVRQEPVLDADAIYLPLVAAGHTVGLAVCSPVAGDDQIDRAFLDAAARQIGIALENARLYYAAVTDELTGLYTQAFFVRRLKEEVDRAAATGRPLSLLRVAIHDFRNLARRHGAAASARVLVEAATTIEQTLPRRNMVARRDAGELLALLVESDEKDARRQGERVAAALQRREFPVLGDEPRPTFTFRNVTYPRDGAAADILLDSLFEVTESWDETDSGIPPLLRIPPELGVMVGKSMAMRAALEVVTRVAPTSASVLLSGETGAGKEVLADLIQVNSDRRDQPYVKVNCAAIPENLVESELFGHEKGAFTGADRRRIGRFEEAHRGTLFLDEIGDLPLPMQVKLLRVLQERSFTRVGGTTSIEVEVRIIAASNRELAAEVKRGAFREDLYHRLHVIELRVPSLRERREEIPHLMEFFRREFNRRHRLEVRAFAPDALDALYRHDWPGNVRQFRNLIERSMLMAGGSVVQLAHLDLPATTPRAPAARTGGHAIGLTVRQERILAYAREHGGITNSTVVSEEDVSARTALRELQRLVERGLLVRVGRRRGAVYRPAQP